MALTNFANLTTNEKVVWQRNLWRESRNSQFLAPHIGTGTNSMIQRITELTKTEKGDKAIITLVHDLEGDGVAGDRTLEGNEEAGTQSDITITIDQLRHATRHEGRMAEQRSVVTFRSNALSTLAYWLSDRFDQMAFLTLSGVAYSKHTFGTDRVGSDLPFLEFANDVTAPTANRYARWDATSGLLINDSNANLVAADIPTWNMFIEVKAFLEENYITPIRGNGGMAMYNVFMTPTAFGKLKQDQRFHEAWRDAMPRSASNELFKGMDHAFIDGLMIRSFRHVYNTRRAVAPNKWGASGDVDGCRVLFCGAQALGYADIGEPEWVEKGFDYENQQAIATGKIAGFRKPKFKSVATGTVEDFGVFCVDVAQ